MPNANELLEQTKESETFALSLFGKSNKIYQPTHPWENLKFTDKDLIGKPVLVTPTAAAYLQGPFRYSILLIPIKLDGADTDFYSIYFKPTITSQQEFVIDDYAPNKVNLSIAHTMVKALEASVGGATPIGVKADVTGKLSWQDAYTINKPLITCMPFNDGTICWQFEKQKAQKIESGELVIYMSLRSMGTLTGQLEIDVAAFDDRPKKPSSKGYTKTQGGVTPYTIDLDNVNLSHMSVDDFLKSRLNTVKIMSFLEEWSALDIDGEDVRKAEA